MKLTSRKPSEAERLAQALTDWKSREVRDLDRLDAAAELRRLAALSESNAIDALNYESRIERLQAEVEALREANEAFGKRQNWWNDRMFALEQELDALRAMHDAAPTVEAQPVAWMDDFGNAFPLAANKGAGSWLDEHKRNWKPLYTHPAAPQPAALPELSDAEILRIAESVPDKDPTLTQPASWGHGFRENADGEYMIPNILPYVTVAFARAVIAALKGKQ